MEKDAEIINDNTSSTAPWSHQEVEKLFQKSVELTHHNDILQQKNSQLETSLESALAKIQWFEEQFKLYRHQQFGKSSESASSLQMELIFNADEGTPAEAETTSEAQKDDTISYAVTRRKKIGRKLDTALLPRQQVVHDLAEKVCQSCQGELHKIRDEVSEQLEIIPRQLYVMEHVHPQYGCRTCATVVSADKTPAPLPKSMAGASLIADVIVSKYDHHLPLYRQSKIFKTFGTEIPDNTLGNWVMQSGEGLRPLEEALKEEILAASYVQADETPVKLLEPEKKAFMWVYFSPLAPSRLVRFRFDLGRSGEVIETDLKEFKGMLQTDGYSGYNGMREKEGIIGFGCNSHARRKFVEVIKIASPKSIGKAQEVINYYKELYRIEDEARQQKLTFEERKQLRQKESKPILEKLQHWLLQTKGQVPPESKISKAINYTLNQWPYLIRYIEYGEAEIDTNWVENEIRPFAVGRNGWLFMGHEGSAQIAALHYSLIQSAKLNNLNPRIYMHYLLTQVHALRKKEVDARSLLPHRIDRQLLQQFADSEYEKAKKLFVTFAAKAQ